MARQRSSEMAELGCTPDISAVSATRHQDSAVGLGEPLEPSSTMPAAAMPAASSDASTRPSKKTWRFEVSPAAPPADSFVVLVLVLVLAFASAICVAFGEDVFILFHVGVRWLGHGLWLERRRL
eukprot:428550-Prymnesium_polylepis.2